MSIVINGSGTVTGLAVGGLPDGSVDSDTLASGIDKTSISDSGDATAITITSAEKIGIGTASPLGTTHIQTASSGATADVSADDLVIENSGHAGLSILSGASNNGNIYFGDSGTNWDGYIAYSQAQRKMTLGTAAGGGSLSIDSTGAVTIPNQPCFSVLATATSNIGVSSWTKINFNNEQFDSNHDFNTINQTFTAPVAGKYLFQLRIRVNDIPSAMGYLHIGVDASNTQQHTTTHIGDFDHSGDITYYTEAASFIFNMAANDTASARIYQNGGGQQMDISTDSCFSGYLLG